MLSTNIHGKTLLGTKKLRKTNAQQVQCLVFSLEINRIHLKGNERVLHPFILDFTVITVVLSSTTHIAYEIHETQEAMSQLLGSKYLLSRNYKVVEKLGPCLERV